MEQQDSDLLAKWLNDSSFINWANSRSGEDVKSWEKWLAQNPEKQPLAETGRQIILGLPFKPITASPDDQQQLSALWQRIDQATLTNPAVPHVANASFFSSQPLYRIAAAILFLLMIGGGSFYYVRYVWAEQTLRTGYEQTRTFVLEDDSKVTLNANSELGYNKFYPRKVRLKGEAFFEVAQKPLTGKKFRVQTPDLEVEVLGTQFNVKNRKSHTEVYLKEGSVKLSLENSAHSCLMKPGEYVVYSAQSSTKYKKEVVAPQLHTSWKNGVTLLESVPLYQVLEEIESIYGIEIELQNDTLRDHILTVALPVESMDIGFETLEHALNLKLSYQNGTYYLE